MEKLADSGLLAGVIDVTTTEVCDLLFGGVLPATEDRLGAIARTKLPYVGSVGALDMVNFWAPETVPEHWKARLFYQHNPNVTLMRTTPEECAELGRILAEKANQYRGPVTMLLPKKAISVISAPGQSFHSPEADAALFESIKQHLDPKVSLIELDAEVNDPEFAAACADALMAALREATTTA